MNLNILFVGAVNEHSLPQGGEEYKNRVFLKYLRNVYNIYLIDTYNWRNKPFTFINLFFSLFNKRFDRIILSASSYSVYRLLRIIHFFPSIARKISYFVIGGYFPDGVIEGKYKIRSYQNLHSVVVEGNVLKEKLLELGLNSKVFVVPNFKEFLIIDHKKNQDQRCIKFVFISRIHPDKGIYEIVEASRKLLEWGFYNFDVTFYGPLELSSTDIFVTQLNDRLMYGGYLDFLNNSSSAYNILAGYDVMLFPTYWKGEGFPGVLVDAFVAGLPVIVSDWNMNDEIIQDGYNGLLVTPKSSHSLALAMKKICADSDLISRLSVNASKSAINYHIDTVASQISKILEDDV